MSSSSEKGNIAPFLLILTAIVIVSLFVSVLKLMVFKTIPSGKYKNPNVASKIVEGSVYDVNGKTLSMQIPVYTCFFNTARMGTNQFEIACNLTSMFTDMTPSEIRDICRKSKTSYVKISSNISKNDVEDFKSRLEEFNLSNEVYISKDFKRVYPSQFHGVQLIRESEEILFSRISPKPGYNVSTTYGDDVYLTLDMDTQYLLDLAVTDIYNSVKPEYIIAFIINAETGAIVASTNYPFDMPINRTFLSEYKGLKPYCIAKVIDHEGNILADGKNFDYNKIGFNTDMKETLELLEDSYSSVSLSLPQLENPKFHVVFAAKNAEIMPIGYLTRAVTTIEAGLRAQSKL